MLGGVCGGLGDYFKIDPTIVRLIFVLLLLAGGPGLIIYLILWVVVPEEPLGAEYISPISDEEDVG
jgi:phage shock protein C